MSLFTAPQNLPFGIGFALIVGIALVEGAGMLISFSPSNLIDHHLPEVSGDTGLDRVLGWLHLGKVPALVLLLLFLSGYTVFGYSLQVVMNGLFGGYLVRDQFSPEPGFVQLLADLPTRFLPGYLGAVPLQYKANGFAGTLLFEYTGVVFWLIVLFTTFKSLPRK